jgi:serine/threonine protein kinase
MSPAAGRVFGAYRLLRSIATDAISTTYLATTDDSGSPSRTGETRFVVRIAGRFDDSDAHAAELVQQFLAAAQKAAAVDHPSIVRPRDIGVIGGHPFVATPFVRAVPLGDMLANGGAINESAALAIFAQLAGGLDAAHRAQVVHGALSSRTIWVGPSTGTGAAYVGYLVGFGSALLLRERLSHEPRGEPIDDLLYVAPEQLRSEPITGASDQYSLACALFHTLTGAPPFRRENRSKLYGAHLMSPPPVLREMDAAAAESTSDALVRAMSKQPSDRFASCGMLINAALPQHRPRPAAAAAAGPATAGKAPRTPWSLVLAGLGLVLVAVLLWLLLSRRGEPSAAVSLANASPTASAVAVQTAAAGSAAASADPHGWLGRQVARRLGA